MIWQIIEITAVIAESFLALYFNIEYFKMKSDRYKYLKILGGTLSLSICDYCGTMLLKTDFFSIAGFLLILYIFSLIFLNGSALEKFVITVVNCTLFVFINLPVLYIFSYVFGQTVLEMTVSTGTERLIILFLTKMLYFIVTQLIVYFRQKETLIFKRDEWVLISSNFIITFLIAFFLYSLSINLWNKLYVYIATVALLILLDIIAFIFMKKINQKNAEEKNAGLLKLSLQQQSQMIDKIKMQYDSMAEMRHNYIHELAYIQGVLAEKNYDKLDDYVNKKLSSEKIKGYNYIFTSNKVIDSVINYKFSIAEQKGISVLCNITADIPEALEHDVSIILANLLDNAIEASEKLLNSKPEIILSISEVSKYYSIMVKNRIDSSVISDNKRLSTTKKNKQRHGYGLRTVKTLIESHNGMIDIYEKDGFFIVNIYLYI